jgi:hypothetical protein
MGARSSGRTGYSAMLPPTMHHPLTPLPSAFTKTPQNRLLQLLLNLHLQTRPPLSLLSSAFTKIRGAHPGCIYGTPGVCIYHPPTHLRALRNLGELRVPALSFLYYSLRANQGSCLAQTSQHPCFQGFAASFALLEKPSAPFSRPCSLFAQNTRVIFRGGKVWR